MLLPGFHFLTNEVLLISKRGFICKPLRLSLPVACILFAFREEYILWNYSIDVDISVLARYLLNYLENLVNILARGLSQSESWSQSPSPSEHSEKPDLNNLTNKDSKQKLWIKMLKKSTNSNTNVKHFMQSIAPSTLLLFRRLTLRLTHSSKPSWVQPK